MFRCDFHLPNISFFTYRRDASRDDSANRGPYFQIYLAGKPGDLSKGKTKLQLGGNLVIGCHPGDFLSEMVGISSRNLSQVSEF